MKQRTLKEVAQAGLVLGFEWIAMDPNYETYLFRDKPRFEGWVWESVGSVYIEITDFPDLPPEKSLLKLSDIVESN